MNKTVRYVAEPTHVREVTLQGSADLSYWRSRLMNEELAPAEHGGKAKILIVAASMTYMGIRFTELSISVRVTARETPAHVNAVFLIHAFNSSRMLALTERAFFRTPYSYGDCRVSTSSPVSIRLIKDRQALFQAVMSAAPSAANRAPSRQGDESWEGPIFLPTGSRLPASRGRVFFGRLKGYARVYPFMPETDLVSIMPSPHADVLQALIDSEFIGEEWMIREDGTHARSRTYRRADATLWQA
jgi:hypothetical protein